jgi:hypothetical protein
MLGVGRPLSWKYSLTEILAAYPVLIIGGFMVMALLTQWAKNREESDAIPANSYAMRNPALAAW